MKFIKCQLLIIALLIFVATSAFAGIYETVNVDTSSLSGQAGYLYLQYDPFNTSVASTATVTHFATDGTLGAQDTVDVANGSAVTGTLPGVVVLANTNGVNDYLHAITFGSAISFGLSFLNTQPFVSSNSLGSSTFSLGLFADALGVTPLLNVTGTSGSVPGTLFMVNLMDNGTVTTQIPASQANVVPIPAALWLAGSGLAGLAGIRRRKQQ